MNFKPTCEVNHSALEQSETEAAYKLIALTDDGVAESSYKFLWDEKSLSSVSDSQLPAALAQIVARIDKESYTPRYRQAYCLISQKMNTLTLMAPAFRPQPTIPWKPSEQTEAHLLIQRDRIVIDCHWLYFTKARVYAQESTWKGILNPKLKLQTERIEKFASTKLRNEYRCESILNLTEFQQVQMAALRGDRVREAFRAFGSMTTTELGTKTPARLKKIDRAIREWTESQPRFEKYYEKYRAYAMAKELLHSPTVSQTSKLAGYIMGAKPLSETGARQAMQHLEKIISKIS